MAHQKIPLILHIGAHKTGSTTIQHFLRAVQADLLAGKILYPRAGCVGESNHSMLAWAARSDPRSAGADHWQQVFDEVEASGAQTVLISGEEFEFLDAREIEALHDRLRDRFDVHVVYYVRRQDEIMVSEYLQWIKTGVIRQPFNEVAQAYLGHKRFQFTRIAMLWQEAFGRGSVTLRSFSRDRLKDGDLLADFQEATGLALPLDKAASDTRVNVSPGLYTLLAGRLVDALDGVFGKPIKRRANYLEMLARALAEAGMKEPRFEGFSGPDRAAFLASYDEDNQRLAQGFFDGEPPFSPIAATPDRPAVPAQDQIDETQFEHVARLALIAWKDPNPAPKFHAALEPVSGELTAALQAEYGIGDRQSTEAVSFLLSQISGSITTREQGRIPGLGTFRRRDLDDGRTRAVIILD